MSKPDWYVSLVDAATGNPQNPGGMTPPTTGTASSVSAATSSVTLLAANANREGAYFKNDSASASCYVLIAAGTASPTNYTEILGPGDSMSLQPGEYTGTVSGIWTAAVGAMRVTEWTP